MSVHSFFLQYPYLGNALGMTLVAAAGLYAFPGHRKAAVLSGLLTLPWGILWPLALVPEYWSPRLTLHIGRVGIEDVLWAFATGGVAWLAAVVPVQGRAPARDRARINPGRCALVGVVGEAVFLPLWLSGVNIMTAFVAAVVILGLVLLVIRRDLWKLAVGGGIGFGLINAFAMRATLAWCPDYYAQMPAGALSGLALWGLPAEEVYWAIATGAVWPLCVRYVSDGAAAWRRVGDVIGP